jgi:hypothetical protein
MWKPAISKALSVLLRFQNLGDSSVNSGYDSIAEDKDIYHTAFIMPESANGFFVV